MWLSLPTNSGLCDFSSQQSLGTVRLFFITNLIECVKYVTFSAQQALLTVGLALPNSFRWLCDLHSPTHSVDCGTCASQHIQLTVWLALPNTFSWLWDSHSPTDSVDCAIFPHQQTQLTLGLSLPNNQTLFSTRLAPNQSQFSMWLSLPIKLYFVHDFPSQSNSV